MTWTCVFLIRFNHSWNRCIVCLTTFYGFWFMALCLHIVCSHTVLCVGFGSFCKHNEPDTDTHYFQFWMRLYGWRFVSAESTFSHFGDFFLCVLSVKCFEMYYALHTYICHFKFRLAKCADELNFERRNATSQEERILIMSILTLFRIFEPMWSSNFDYMFVLLETDKKRTIFKHMWIFFSIYFFPQSLISLTNKTSRGRLLL